MIRYQLLMASQDFIVKNMKEISLVTWMLRLYLSYFSLPRSFSIGSTKRREARLMRIPRRWLEAAFKIIGILSGCGISPNCNARASLKPPFKLNHSRWIGESKFYKPICMYNKFLLENRQRVFLIFAFTCHMENIQNSPDVFVGLLCYRAHTCWFPKIKSNYILCCTAFHLKNVNEIEREHKNHQKVWAYSIFTGL